MALYLDVSVMDSLDPLDPRKPLPVLRSASSYYSGERAHFLAYLLNFGSFCHMVSCISKATCNNNQVGL